jgi:uroporphyrinogen-III synthase
MMRIKSILVSQPAPSESSPYLDIAKKEKIKIDFRPFIHVEGVDNKELRTQKIDLTQYTGIIFTSKNAIDHYFRLAEELRFSVPDTMRYICQSEAIANYLQKHIVYRKRKISFGEKISQTFFLCSKNSLRKISFAIFRCFKSGYCKTMDASNVDWTRAIMYRTVCSDLTDINIKDYDMLIFFSPQGINLYSRISRISNRKKQKSAFLEQQLQQQQKKQG